jgi:hypothetical protein
MQTRWIDVPQGARVRGRDGYEWTVAALMSNGWVKLVRDGREAFGFMPAPGALVDVTYSPPEAPGATMRAVATLRSVMTVEVIECAWCLGDDTQDCVCERHCGESNCVNFATTLTT